jgi:hypothetical protein
MQVWLAFNAAWYIKEQHRIKVDTPGGEMLYRFSRRFMQWGVSKAQIAEVCDSLNARALANLQDADGNPLTLQGLVDDGAAPRVIVQRQKLRLPLNKLLDFAEARRAGHRVLAWRAHDVAVPMAGREDLPAALPNQVLDALNYVPSSKTKGIGAIQYFYPGITYVFTDNTAPQYNRVTNNQCTAAAIVLHEDEGPDLHPNCPVRMLRYIPRAIMVRPYGPPLGPLCGADMPDGCIPVEPATVVIDPEYPGPMEVDGVKYNGVSIQRKGMPLAEARVHTDYYSQGMSFKGDKWIVDMRVPSDGQFHRASILVILTRYSSWDDVILLHPLWPAGDADERQRVIDKYYATTQDPAFLELVMDIDRIKHLAVCTARDARCSHPPGCDCTVCSLADQVFKTRTFH